VLQTRRQLLKLLRKNQAAKRQFYRLKKNGPSGLDGKNRLPARSKKPVKKQPLNYHQKVKLRRRQMLKIALSKFSSSWA